MTQQTDFEIQLLSNIKAREEAKLAAGWHRCPTCGDLYAPDETIAEHRAEMGHTDRRKTITRVTAGRRGADTTTRETYRPDWWNEDEPWTPDGSSVKPTTPIERGQFQDMQLDSERRKTTEQRRAWSNRSGT